MIRLLALGALLLALPARAECVKSETRVTGRSLEPLVRDGTTLPVLTGPDCRFDVHRGDVVLLKTAASKLPLVKIVRAMPGDAFGLAPAGNGFSLTVNGEIVRNSAGLAYHFSPARAATLQLYERDYKGRIPPKAWLVLGDDPAGTLDATRFGLVSEDELLGKALLPGRRPAGAP